MAQTRLKSGNLHMVGGDNGTSGNVLKSKGDGTMEWGVAINPPGFSSFDYPGNDTALDPAGGQSLVINGSGFNSGVTVTIGGTTPSSITLNSATQITVTTPAKSAGSQALVITNTDGGSASASVSYNGIPAFTNAAGSLASVRSGATINVSAAATEPDGGAITYAITSGSLPSGISLNTSTGAITGTAPSVDASTTSNFTVTATDNENQSTARAYSITVTPPLPSDKFKVVTYTGNGSTQSITGVGFKPDLVWVKVRSTTGSGPLADSSRGTRKAMYSNLDSADYTFPAGQGITSFDADGFSIGDNSTGNGGYNGNGKTYVAWCWKANGGTTSSNSDGTITSTVQANQDAGFSIVTYTGTGANATVGHGLGAQPYVVITKGRDSVVGTTNWRVYTNALGGTKNLKLNGNDAAATGNSTWNDTDPTSSVFSLGTSGDPNGNNATYVAYCFAPVAGFSKFGSYTGNGSANGPIVETGFEPAFLIVKSTTGSGWDIWDNKRNTTNPRNTILTTNNNAADYTSTSNVGIDFLSNGFQIKNTNADHNANGNKYIYIAFATDPDTTAPTLADSFNVKNYTGNGGTKNVTGLGFKPSLVWLKNKAGTTWHNLTDSVRGVGKQLNSNANSAEEYNAEFLQSFDSDGFTLGGANGYNNSGVNFASWNWKGDDNEPTIFGGGARAVYKFEDNGNDVAGELNLTASNMSYSSSGKFNKAAEFNGNNSSFANASISGLPTGTSPMSMSYWVYTSTANQDAGLVGYGRYNPGGSNSGAANKYFGTMLSGGNLFFAGYYYNAAFSPAVTLPTGQWNHLVWTFDGTNVRAYLNGSLAGTMNRSSLDIGGGSGNLAVAIGKNAWSGTGSEHFNGKIDQVRIYSGKLEDVQVAKLYTETTSDNDNLNFGGPPEHIINANKNAGFSIVKYTSNGLNPVSIPHGLSTTPNMILIKCTSNASTNWIVYNSSLGQNKYLTLNTGSAADTSGNWLIPNALAMKFNNTFGNVNTSGRQYVAYCFNNVNGYSKFGSYTSNASVKITTGFQPDFFIFKYIGSGDWYIQDSTQSEGVTGSHGGDLIKKYFEPNNDIAENSVSTGGVEIMSDGFYPTNWFETTNGVMYAAFKIN